MLAVALVAGVGRSSDVWLAAGLALALTVPTIFLGGRFHKEVRKRPWAQVATSALLGALILPIEGIGQVPIRLAIYDSVAWMTVFAAFSLTVRAVFARARKGGSGARITTVTLVLPAICGFALYLPVEHRNTSILLVGFAGSLLFAIWRPKPRHLKRSGAMMTALLALAVVLALG